MHDTDPKQVRRNAQRAPRRRILGSAIAVTIGSLVGGLVVRGSKESSAAAAVEIPASDTRFRKGTSEKEAPMAGSKAETGFGVGGDEGRALWFLDGLVVWKALGADTAGRYELVEQLGAGGYEAPLHTHGGETEGFYVVEGDLTMVVGDLRFHAGAGAFGYVPIGVPHAFKVDSPMAKFLTFITPPGLEGYFEELGQVATARTLPPPGLVLPSDAQINAVANKYGTTILGPFPEA